MTKAEQMIHFLVGVCIGFILFMALLASKSIPVLAS